MSTLEAGDSRNLLNCKIYRKELSSSSSSSSYHSEITSPCMCLC